jgi:PDZ domain-containing protein
MSQGDNPVSKIRTWFGRLSLWVRRLLLMASLLVLLGLTLWLTPTPYYLTAPGAAIDTGRVVTVQGGAPRQGHLFLLVVNTQPADLFWYLYAKLDHRAVLETRQEYLGDITDYDKYLELTRQMMLDSQATAKAVALQELGYGKGVTTMGAVITDILQDSPARNLLMPGDLVTEAGTKQINMAKDLSDLLAKQKPGDVVQVKLLRQGALLSVNVPTVEHPDASRKGTAAFRVLLKDALKFDIPIPIQVRAGAITGPSAGLMFTLQVIDQLTPGGLTGNRVIAGTGTIEQDGKVGEIGGIQQKVYTAEAAQASVMFVPRNNYAAAKLVATRILLVPVDHVHDALVWLREHQPNQ